MDVTQWLCAASRQTFDRLVTQRGKFALSVSSPVPSGSTRVVTAQQGENPALSRLKAVNLNMVNVAFATWQTSSVSLGEKHCWHRIKDR